MIPSIQSVASRRAGPRHQHRRSSSGSHELRNQTALPIPMAQECIEAPRFLHDFVYVHNPSRDPSLRHMAEEQNLPTDRSNKLTRVKLTKSPNSDRDTGKFFVRTAGGMSVSIPELPPEPTSTAENVRVNIATPQPVSQLEDSTLKSTVTPAITPVTKTRTNQSNSYLPLSVELIAGRGQTSMPSDGNKSTTNTKVRSLPPSHTLAMSASFIKSYFSSGPEKQQSKSAGSTPETETSVKTKMLGLWNNVKFGWTVNLKTNFSRDSPVYLLGCVYHKCLGEDEENSEEEVERHGMEAFKRHFHSLVWCTYRRQFPTLQDSTLTTDCGWGCMLRTGQMMLAHALIRHFLTKDWRYNKNITGPDDLVHRSILRWFGDSPSPHCPLSLHNLVHFGQKLGKKAGDWYGPASVAYIFKEAVEMGSKYIPDLQRVCVYVAQDCAVYIQDVLDLCFSSCVCNKGNLINVAKVIHKRKSTVPQGGFSLPADKLGSSPVFKKASKADQMDGNKLSSEKRYCQENEVEQDTGLDSEIIMNGKCCKDSQTEMSRQTQKWHFFSSNLSTGVNDQETDESVNREKQDGLVGSQSFEQCSVCDNWRSVLVMVPIRLGGEALNPIYAPCLYSLFTHDLCVGIIGGRPRHSLYFVGFQDDSLIHLDPHLCQDAVMVTQQYFSLSSYHCSSPRKMALSRMDPSATLGFYCHSRLDFLRLMEELPELVTPKQPGFEYPIFEFLDGRCEDADACARQVTTEDEMAASLPGDTPLLPQDSEEFVFL
nr:cysteine protease ATG4D-like [Procambarus clarkii]XP_045620054.1 cysteine protease ATG4D-like [Procambarus clarkii]XP_045620055.1 cysteine protease ATG4D-like [Procambarus clarkii]XP_045620056.1 cysteine protease ATG4D-like [Procambarus clarkii]XP_045620057.1 cysteine protease ATG4D-like [Procambarus clarkii]